MENFITNSKSWPFQIPKTTVHRSSHPRATQDTVDRRRAYTRMQYSPLAGTTLLARGPLDPINTSILDQPPGRTAYRLVHTAGSGWPPVERPKFPPQKKASVRGTKSCSALEKSECRRGRAGIEDESELDLPVNELRTLFARLPLSCEVLALLKRKRRVQGSSQCSVLLYDKVCRQGLPTRFAGSPRSRQRTSGDAL